MLLVYTSVKVEIGGEQRIMMLGIGLPEIILIFVVLVGSTFFIIIGVLIIRVLLKYLRS